MDRPFSSSSSHSPSSPYSPPSAYPRSVETTSQEPTSSRSSPIHTTNIPRSYSPSFYPGRSSSGRSAIDFFNIARRGEGMGLNPDESYESYMSRHRCLRYYGAWDMCVHESIRNGVDYRFKCALASKLLRNCVRDT